MLLCAKTGKDACWSSPHPRPILPPCFLTPFNISIPSHSAPRHFSAETSATPQLCTYVLTTKTPRGYEHPIPEQADAAHLTKLPGRHPESPNLRLTPAPYRSREPED
ncbi:unnamed protein product [Laminaria digitata]